MRPDLVPRNLDADRSVEIDIGYRLGLGLFDDLG
jgi:hypothetical protein